MVAIIFVMAQLAVASIDVSKVLPLGQVWVTPADLDADPTTREWVAWDTSGDKGSWFRTIDVRPDGTLCVGAYVWPWPDDPGRYWYGYVGRAGDRDRLLLQSYQRYIEVTLTPCREQDGQAWVYGIQYLPPIDAA